MLSSGGYPGSYPSALGSSAKGPVKLRTVQSVSLGQSGALSLVQILELLCSDWLNLTMLAPRSMP